MNHIRFLLYPLLVMIVSWIHFFSTGSLQVDFNPIQPLHLRILCFCSIVVSYIIFYYSIYQLLIKDSFQVKSLRQITYLLIGISFFTLPLFSNDFFSLLTYSESFLNGYDIYSNFNAHNQSSFASFINPNYAQINCKYGPINVLLMAVPLLIGGKNLLVVFWLSKLVFLVFTILYAEISLRLISESKMKHLSLIFIPVWFIQGLGQFHNDIIGVSLVVLGYYLLMKDKLVWSIVMFTLAALSKFTFLIFMGLPILFFLERKETFKFKEIVKLGIEKLIIIVLLGVVFYFPFLQNIEQVIAPLRAMNEGIPSSTFADLTAYIMSFFNHDLKGNFAITMPVFRYIGIGLFILVAYRYMFNHRKVHSHKVIILSLFSILILVYSHRFLPWYLMVVPLFVDLFDRKDWLKWLFWISFWSMFQDFAIMLDTNNIYGQFVMAIGVVFTVLLFFYKIRSRLIDY